MDLITEKDLIDIKMLSKNLEHRMQHLYLFDLWTKNKIWISL